jgi:5-amino-6-(5-phosphoribosylamino)uracil reductase/diaminohydroxyphosphoribosylaminopyrimidine deaminase/5-amino-6-(5-phosphoribosylamino)uracil reductase
MESPPRPRVTVHFAQSLDGRIGVAGVRAVLSSPEGMEIAHRARAEHDAVLVGSNTVRVDDPKLTVRACPGPHPKRIVLASALDVSPHARIFAGGSDVLILGAQGRADAAARARIEALGAEVRLVPACSEGRVSLVPALSAIDAWGVRRLLVEGGARVLTAFLRERLVDFLEVEIAPRLYGAPAIAALGAIGLGAPDRAFALAEMRVDRAGDNLLVRGRVVY